MSLLNSQQCKAVLAVNYFGFAQDLVPFREYCLRTGATLIEDNAHGFLSKDTSGVLLGTRANLGITSIRKTFRLVNGAALYFSGVEYSSHVAEQLEFQNGAAPKGFLLRKVSAQIQRSTKILTLSLFKFTIRMLRLIATGPLSPKSTQETETEVPTPGPTSRNDPKLSGSPETKG